MADNDVTSGKQQNEPGGSIEDDAARSSTSDGITASSVVETLLRARNDVVVGQYVEQLRLVETQRKRWMVYIEEISKIAETLNAAYKDAQSAYVEACRNVSGDQQKMTQDAQEIQQRWAASVKDAQEIAVRTEEGIRKGCVDGLREAHNEHQRALRSVVQAYTKSISGLLAPRTVTGGDAVTLNALAWALMSAAHLSATVSLSPEA
jgi:flagellar biosynthesis/type III secretory pathway protein FliH